MLFGALQNDRSGAITDTYDYDYLRQPHPLHHQAVVRHCPPHKIWLGSCRRIRHKAPTAEGLVHSWCTLTCK
jgi:hypothetical protein